ncbi:MAG: hypothetical protein AAB444_03660 [Patescibacteria group bacterium]
MTTRQKAGIGGLLFGILLTLTSVSLLNITALIGPPDSHWVFQMVLGFWVAGMGIHMIFGPPVREITRIVFPVLVAETTVLGMGLGLFSLLTRTTPWIGLWLAAGIILASAVYFCRPHRSGAVQS